MMIEQPSQLVGVAFRDFRDQERSGDPTKCKADDCINGVSGHGRLLATSVASSFEKTVYTNRYCAHSSCIIPVDFTLATLETP
jgi:hypothetical protein